METKYCSSIPNLPVYSVIDKMDPCWALESARQIVTNYQPTDYGNNSGKFFKNYMTYWFHHSSNLPLIKNFIKQLENRESEFESVYHGKLAIDFVFLAYIKDASIPSCIYHRDGYFWDGLFHLSILGNSKIHYIEKREYLPGDEEKSHLMQFENGTVWFFNSTQLVHQIATQPGERFELCAPLRIRPDYVERCLEGYQIPEDGFMNGQNSGWKKNKSVARNYITEAVTEKRASNNEIASFVEEGD